MAGGGTLNQELHRKFPNGLGEGEICEVRGRDRSRQSVRLKKRAASPSPCTPKCFDHHQDYCNPYRDEDKVWSTNEYDEDNDHEIEEDLCGVVEDCLVRLSKGKRGVRPETRTLKYSPAYVATCIFQSLDRFIASHTSTSIREMIYAAEEDYAMRSQASADLRLPVCWNPMTDDDFYISVPLNFRDREYMNVANAFSSGVGRCVIEKIERIQNKTLFYQYKMQRTLMETKHPDIVIERNLWHGTSENSVDSINIYGFSRSYSGKNGSRYGEGSYFAVSPEYAANFSPPDKHGLCRLYMVGVLTGHFTTGCHGMRTPPPRDPNRPHLKYDTVVDSTSKPKIFVVFNDVQAYPKYLITFRKK